MKEKYITEGNSNPVEVESDPPSYEELQFPADVPDYLEPKKHNHEQEELKIPKTTGRKRSRKLMVILAVIIVLAVILALVVAVTYLYKTKFSVADCGAGQYILEEVCTECPAGTYKATGGRSSTCDPCPKGTYQQLRGQMQCLECPLQGTTTSEVGVKHPGECNICAPGYYKSGARCFPCELGFYSEEDSESCTKCPPNYTTALEGALCECPKGFFLSGPNCLSCPDGKYNDKANRTSCMECESGILSVPAAACAETVPGDCQDWVPYQIGDGVYMIKPLGSQEMFPVYCQFVDNKGWTVFQRRFDGSIEFYRDWSEYENGFGDISGEHWLGLSKVKEIITANPDREFQLEIVLERFSGEIKNAVYTDFRLEDSNYTLQYGSYSGAQSSLADGFGMSKGYGFTTKDKDNDSDGLNCANIYHTAWWMSRCFLSNLNGPYQHKEVTNYAIGIIWQQGHSYHISFKSSIMRIRSQS